MFNKPTITDNKELQLSSSVVSRGSCVPDEQLVQLSLLLHTYIFMHSILRALVTGTSVKIGQFVIGNCVQREHFHRDCTAPKGTLPQASLCLERQLHFHDDSRKNSVGLFTFSADQRLALRNKSPAFLGTSRRRPTRSTVLWKCSSRKFWEPPIALREFESLCECHSVVNRQTAASVEVNDKRNALPLRLLFRAKAMDYIMDGGRLDDVMGEFGSPHS